MKITETGYFLPIIDALVPGRVLSSGRTKPQVITGMCVQTLSKDDYVVKFKAADQMTLQSCARELLAAFIGIELGLNIPAPALVNVSDAFVKSMLGKENYGVANKSLGVNFGSQYVLDGFMTLTRGQQIPSALLKDLAHLFAFDVLISNADRRIDKHNFTVNGDEILIFDHEAAFGFVYDLPFSRNKQPWLIRDEEMKWISQNYCFNALVGKSVDFDDFVSKFEVLDSNFWKQVLSFIPSEWHSDQINQIQEYTDSIVNNCDAFSTELKRILK